MRPFTVHTGVAAALLRDNIDTDAIIPSREMKTVSKTGLADGLFAGWRYLAPGTRDPDPSFVLNRPEQRGTSILLAGANFGCGSSREHAVWALAEYGIRCIVAPSFGSIFANNCVRNGVLPLVLSAERIAGLAQAVAAEPQSRQIRIDLERCVLTSPDGTEHAFNLSRSQREMLLHGLDAIALTLTMATRIESFEQTDRQARPWLYGPKVGP